MISLPSCTKSGILGRVRYWAALALGVFPATARATGSGLEYVVFGFIGLIPAVFILFVLIAYVLMSRLLTMSQRMTLVVTYAATSTMACTALLLIGDRNLSFFYSPLVWIGPLIIVFWQRAKYQ
jgi:hypothetical protein